MDARVRFGFKPTAKGTVNLDVTSEAPTAEEAEALLKDGISRFKALVISEGYTVTEIPK